MPSSRPIDIDYIPRSRFATPTTELALRHSLNLRSGGNLALSREEVVFASLLRYCAVLDATLASLALSADEARWLVDRLKDVVFLPSDQLVGAPVGEMIDRLLLVNEVSDAGDAQTSAIDYRSLHARVRRGGTAAEVALLDAAERFWMLAYEEIRPDLRLRVVGLLRAA